MLVVNTNTDDHPTPHPHKKLHPKIVDFICIFLSRRVFYAVFKTWLLPPLCPMLWIHTTLMMFTYSQSKIRYPKCIFYAVFKTWLLPLLLRRLKFLSLLSATFSPPLFLLHYINSYVGCLIIFSFLTSNISFAPNYQF